MSCRCDYCNLLRRDAVRQDILAFGLALMAASLPRADGGKNTITVTQKHKRILDPKHGDPKFTAHKEFEEEDLP